VTSPGAPGGPSLDERVLALVEAAHRVEPWSLGVTSLALSRRLEIAEPLLLADLARLVLDGRLERRFGYYAAPAHAVALTAEQLAFFERLLPNEGDATPSPLAYAVLSSAVRSGSVDGVSKAFDTLLATGALVRVGDDCYRGSQLAEIRRRVDAHFRNRERLTVAEFRDLAGTTRKHAVPLLEWFDASGVTRRDGIDRIRGDAD
jgi:selenocysteine-specific elongation factor